MKDDFTKGRRGPVVPPDPKKVRITIRLDADVIGYFKELVHRSGGGNYQTLINQTLINEALREHIAADDKALERKLRKIIREEIRKAS